MSHPQFHKGYYCYNSLYIIVLLILSSLGLCNAQQQDISIANEYWAKGEKQKAYELFRSLAKTNDNLPLIHNTYLNVLLTMAKYKEAEDHVERMIKREPGNLNYKVDLGLTYIKEGDLPKAEKYLRALIKSSVDEPFKIKVIADNLIANGLPEYAQTAYLELRQNEGSATIFSLELANVYRLQGKKDDMVAEYLNYVTQTPGNLNYVKNLLQILLTKPDELESLEKILLDKVQRYPDSDVFIDLLIWDYQQQKNFYGAFIQARAYDKRFGKGQPKKLYEIALVAFNNKDYDNAERCYAAIVKDFAKSEEFLPSRLGLIRTTEAKVKRKFPVNLDSITVLVGQYDGFVKQFPDIPTSYESLISQAQLYAYYLNRFDSALSLLGRVTKSPKASPILRARAKLETGDIFLLKDEPWEATLLYSQVEKAQKDAPLGYEAKLRNARLSYFQGDFKLAEAHLDILKEATSREIANDAMELSLRIKENTAMDSVGTALKIYAAVERLLYQNKTEEALARVDELKKGISPTADTTVNFTNYAILDDVLWLESKLRIKKGEFTEALALLQRIVDEYPEDVLADDAWFTRADILEHQLNDTAKAMELYRTFLDKFPGSVYAAEARKRFRQLRGDFSGKEM
jgi:outer membrane protein assembly factor BamD (BamD/ComL family)/Flp pilus assembly protein TadD